MKMIHITAIIYLFSVVIPIQSGEIMYTYDYDNLGDIFPQGSGINDFHLYKYADIDDIFDEKYKGSNIGGAYLIGGSYETENTEAHIFPGYIVNITATFYCGSTNAEGGSNSLWIWVNYVDGDVEGTYLCEDSGWHYDYVWTPAPMPTGKQGFTVGVMANKATVNNLYGFDELRITTTPLTKPPQLLQHDNNSASINPRENISSNNP